jgi:hypothetical protein
MSISIIVSLYESNYPITQDEEPIWQNLPLGFFLGDRAEMGKILAGNKINLYGAFYYADRFNGDKPRVGEHLLAAFSYKGERYLYNSTLSYIISDVSRKWRWDAILGLTKFIRKW